MVLLLNPILSMETLLYSLNSSSLGAEHDAIMTVVKNIPSRVGRNCILRKLEWAQISQIWHTAKKLIPVLKFL